MGADESREQLIDQQVEMAEVARVDVAVVGRRRRHLLQLRLVHVLPDKPVRLHQFGFFWPPPLSVNPALISPILPHPFL